MLKKYILKLSILFIGFAFFSCNNEKKEYYENGNLEKTYTEKNNLLDGVYKEYYIDGKIKETHQYKLGERIDTSYYFYSSKDQLIEKTQVWRDSIVFEQGFNKSGEKKYQGDLIFNNSKPTYRVGVWRFFKRSIDSLVEYKLIDNKSYTNQIWVIKDKDTLLGRGNSFYFKCLDTVKVNEVLRVKFYLHDPFFKGLNSDVYLLVPKENSDLKKDYSNFMEIKKDTILSLKNDGIFQSNIPKGLPTNHIIEYGLRYSDVGTADINGTLVEYIKKPDGTYEHRFLYFDKEITIIGNDTE